MHHQIVMIESGGKTAVFVGRSAPNRRASSRSMGHGLRSLPLDTLTFKRAFLREAIDREYLILFEHDPNIAAGYIRERKREEGYIEPVA